MFSKKSVVAWPPSAPAALPSLESYLKWNKTKGEFETSQEQAAKPTEAILHILSKMMCQIKKRIR